MSVSVLARLARAVGHHGEDSVQRAMLGAQHPEQVAADYVLRRCELIAGHRVELFEIEALFYERLPSSWVRRLRIEGPCEPWRPCSEITPCAPGTVWYSPEMYAYEVELAEGSWLSCFGDPPPEGLPIEDLRHALYKGEVHVVPELKSGAGWRSSLSIWSRAPLEHLLRRLDEGLRLRAPDLHRALLPPVSTSELAEFERTCRVTLPASLKALWRYTGGFARPPEQLPLWSFARVREYVSGYDSGWPFDPMPLELRCLVPFLEGADPICVDTGGEWGAVGAVASVYGTRVELLHESLDDWLEGHLLRLERGSIAPTLTSPGYARYNFGPDTPSLRRVGVEPIRSEPETPLSLALHFMETDPQGRQLMDAAAVELVAFGWDAYPQGPPSLAVLRDWLADQGAVLEIGSAAALVSRLAPLLEPR